MYPLLQREQTTFQFFWENRTVAKEFQAGVSLHSHTMYSEECLEVLPKHVGKIPLLGATLESNSVDYSKAFWTPPLSPRQAHRLEEKQIQRQFQRPGLVSLTDHDSIHAGSLLCVIDQFGEAPISVEWTVPFGPTFFHLGIHNLPCADAPAIMDKLGRFTADPSPSELRVILAWLCELPNVLLVLNHPLWDEKQIGQAGHLAELMSLLALAGEFLHALELNGLRSWAENRAVIALGNQKGLPLVSGGDRHGCEPNAIVNLTSAATFAGFVHELRYDRSSHVVFMPQYRESLSWRTAQVVIDILRDYPSSFEGRRLWTERVFYRHPEGAQSMASIWANGSPPRMFGIVSKAVGVVQFRFVRSLMRYALSSRDPEWHRQDLRAFGTTSLA